MNPFAYMLLILTTSDVMAQKGKEQKCGLPSFIATLPDYAQVELKDLWKTYIEGEPCDKELMIQQDVLNVVNTFSKDISRSGGTKANSSGGRSIVPAATIPEEYDDASIWATTPFPQLIENNSPHMIPNRKPREHDYEEMTIDDIATLQFNNANAPFLRSLPVDVRRKFEKIWNDADIPSESLRTEKIQALAVSLLTAKQLEEYNKWATKRRYVLKAREQELRPLSSDAKRTLRRLSDQHLDTSKFSVSPAVKKELRDFVTAFNRRRSKVKA